MEALYDPVQFKSSDHLYLKTYFEEFNKIYNSLEENNNLLHNKELAEECSIDKLTLKDEPKRLPMSNTDILNTCHKLDYSYHVTESARKLEVVRHREKLQQKSSQDDVVTFNKRFFRLRCINSEISTVGDIPPGPEFICTVIIYRPFIVNYAQKNRSSSLKFSSEIEVLGCNKLSDIADNIKCPSNDGLIKKVERPTDDLSHLRNAKDHYPSQTIFIDGVFYNDTRLPGAVDYSKEIIRWAEQKNIGKFSTSSMEYTTLNSLKPRIGYPYLYIHQGNCEHILCFSDARLITKSEALQFGRFPRVMSISRKGCTLCYLCGHSVATWMVNNCDRLPHEKVFLCAECCNSYLYIDGEKVTSFNLYPFYDHSVD